MKELSLNVLDITQNSVTAGATEILILLDEDEQGILTLTISDNGCGMSPETVARVIDPFYTTRTTRKVGMGIPLLKLSAEQTGGSLCVTSRSAAEFPGESGTVIKAVFHTRHIDCPPMGDIVSTFCTVIQGHPDIRYVFRHRSPSFEVNLDTAQVRAMLGKDIPLSSYEVLKWISGYLRQQYNQGIN